jgi:DNA-binding NarL/FixJ family response regulator
VRRGLTALVGSESDLAVCADATAFRAAREANGLHRPDLAIVDLALGKEDGLDRIKKIKVRHPEIPSLVVLSTAAGRSCARESASRLARRSGPAPSCR